MDILHCDMNSQNRLVIRSDEKPLMVVHLSDWIIEDVQQVTERHWLAWDVFKERGRHRLVPFDAISLSKGQWTLVDRASRALATIRLEQPEPWHLLLQLDAADHNRSGWVWWGPQGERLYGFGEYGDGPRMPDGTWSTWTEEGPVGLGPLSPLLRWTGLVPLPGHRATYAPSPTWLSSLGYAAWIEEKDRIDWSIRGSRRRLRIWGSQVRLHLVAGSTLKEALTRRNLLLGLPRMPAIWQFGPWNDAVQGQDNVLKTAARLREHRIPSSAIWIEDWTGSWEDEKRFWMRPLSHQLSRRLYPQWERMVEQLHQDGFKVLGYFCPEVAVDTPLFHEAQKGGHLVLDSGGQWVDIDILGKHHGELDLTRPETREWVKSRVFSPAVEMGFDGWMADFGEHLPVGSQLADGSDGWQSHNRWPLLWQSLNREFWEAQRPNGDYSFFVRSAGLETPSLAPAMWGGDSDTDWDRADGLPTVVPQALSAGLSGNVFWGTDIAGYMTFGLTRPSTRELYIRWTEVAALMPLMRTHHGTARPRNHHWSRDAQTQAAYARMARLHAALFPVFYTLAVEATTAGLPLIRPVWLEYPQAKGDGHGQFLLGTSLLMAPIIRPRQERQTVYLPSGTWVHWWTGKVFSGPGPARVDAPLGFPALFWRRDVWLPLSEGMPDADGDTLGFVDTLATAEGAQTVSRSLSLLRFEDSTTPLEIHLPGGTLSGITAVDEERRSTPVSAPRYREHLPPLTEGRRLDIPPNTPVAFAKMKWFWSGTAPLLLTVRNPVT
ncbi:TIM-barrel domain-containing protein [Sulfobacillus harzensis]|uniref:Glycoside hydrolase n=1 Tax=Sulfobacillus harzensis TaxID=2729629 RepID=A0A7Y0L0N3_9FIRM|nr:TIM-barrel domain-containing protein [Sulfobacillus harzensis]NMP20863.1 glycoside hydrolase [Sulfobacillus harzensis]